MKEKKYINVQIGSQIKRAREAAGLTQDQFAEMIKMGTKNLSSIERGLVGVSVSTVKRICETLSISSDMLIMEEPREHECAEIDLLAERLKRLPAKQCALAIDIINKLFEVFAQQNNDAISEHPQD